MIESCSNCKFVFVQQKKYYICRRNPPRNIIDRGELSSLFPTTYAEHWCGEYRPKPVERTPLICTCSHDDSWHPGDFCMTEKCTCQKFQEAF